MTARGLIIAAPHSGAGKTTVTLALLAALVRRGIKIRAAKAGPDYIDPAFHAAAIGRPSVNLDSWAMPGSLLDALAAQAAERRRYFDDRRRHGPVRWRTRHMRPQRRDRRTRGAFRFAGRAGARRVAAGAIGRRLGARFCDARSRRADRRRHPQSRRQRTPPRAGRRRDRGAGHSCFRRRAARGGAGDAGAASRAGAGRRTCRSRGADGSACRDGQRNISISMPC